MTRAAAVLLWSLLALASCGGPAAPWTTAPATGLDLKLACSADEVALFEPLQVTLDLFVAPGLDVAFAPETSLDAAAWRSAVVATSTQELLGGQWRRTVLELRPRRGPGPLVVPPFRAATKDDTLAATTPERTVQVRSALGGAEPSPPTLESELAADVRAFGEPFELPWDWRPAALVGGGALLVLVLLGLWFRPRRRTMAAEVALPPHVRALRELQRLRDAARTTETQIDAFYVGTSQVLREYLEERFGLRAPERTTEEFLRDLEGGDALATAHRAELERFLHQCDLVKFAGVRPGETEHLATWQLAAAFVEATRVDRVVAAPAVLHEAPVAEVVR